VVVVVVALVVLGLVGVTNLDFVGHDNRRVVASTSAAQHPADPTTHAVATTTTELHRTTIAVEPVSTTAATVKKASATTTPSTARYTPAPTGLKAPPATSPPTSAAPMTTNTIATTASLRIEPSTANFPSLPPPYWPMPIVVVTVTNTGGVTIRSVVVHPVGVYSVPSSSCSTLTSGQSCVARVQFCPTSPNHYLDTLVVTGQDAVTGSTLHTSIPLDGTAT
jgi:hypothetical protein